MIRFLTAAALCVSVATPTLSAEGKDMTQDQQDVLNAITSMTDAFHSSDIENVMASYEAQATVAFEPGTPVSDDALLRAGFEGFFGLNPKFVYSGHEVIVSGDTALHIAPWDMTGTAPDGAAIGMSGLSVAVLHRQSNGDWKMVIDNPFGSHLMAAQ